MITSARAILEAGQGFVSAEYSHHVEDAQGHGSAGKRDAQRLGDLAKSHPLRGREIAYGRLQIV